MLILSRKNQQKIELPDCGVTIVVLDTRSNCVRLGIEAPPEIHIRRAELPAEFRRRVRVENAVVGADRAL